MMPSVIRQMWMNVHAVAASRNGGVREQGHRGSPVSPVKGEVLGDEVAVTDEVMLLDVDRSEIVVDVRRMRSRPRRPAGRLHG